MNKRINTVAKKCGFKVTDDYQVIKRLNSLTEFIVIGADPLENSDLLVVSNPMYINLQDYFDPTNPSGFSDELQAIIYSFYESMDDFEESYENNFGLRNQMLAMMIYESATGLNSDYGKCDEDFVIDYICEMMELYADTPELYGNNIEPSLVQKGKFESKNIRYLAPGTRFSVREQNYIRIDNNLVDVEEFYYNAVHVSTGQLCYFEGEVDVPIN